MPMALKVLKVLFPVWLLLVVVALLTATGGWLRWTPRFGGLSWGLTELAHVWVGWVSLAVVVGYLAPHFATCRDLPAPAHRLLGLATAAAAVIVLGTGVVLGVGVVGGPPGWIRPLHFWGTWALLALMLAHLPAGWLSARARRRAEERAAEPEDGAEAAAPTRGE